MATVSPPSNLGFTPSLTVDLTGGVYSTDYDSADYDVARSVTYYVDPEEGNDSNNGTSWGTAFATLTKAITEANAQTSAEINLRPGTGYTAGWGTTAISKPVTIQGVGGKAIISNGRGGKDFSVTTAPVYRRNGHSVTACYDFSKLDSDGAPQSLTLVADIATVTSTPGSFTIDSGNCYVHLEDGRAPDDDFCTAGGSVSFCQLAAGATSFYMKDVITVGSPTRHLTAIQDSAVVQVVCEDCEWHYCKGTTTDAIQIDARGLFIFKNNLLTNADKDGINYRPGTVPNGEFWEIDCTVIKCGISGVDACNCSTGHETSYIVRVNGTYKEARHRCIHDIGAGTRSWNVNCSAQAGTVADTYVPGAWCSGIPDDGTRMFLEACTASGDEAHFLPLGASAEIIMRNMAPLPNTGGELPIQNIAARVLAAMNANPPDVVVDSLSAAAISSVEQSLTNNDFSLLDTFTDTDGAALASHAPEINFSARPWLKQNGQNMVISDEGGGVFVAKPVADDFTPARTLYTMDAGSENYIIRARLSGFRVAPGMLMFRVAANDSYYGILFNHDTVASYLRIFEFNGDETTTLADVNPGSLVSESYHWYQIHVAGSRVRAFVEGFNVEAVAEMSINLSETRIGIGGQRASTKFDAIEVIPLQPGAAGEAFSTKLDVLTASTERLATSVPSAITSLKGELGESAVAAMNANPPSVGLTASAISSLGSSLAGTVVVPLNAVPLRGVRNASTKLFMRKYVNFTHAVDDVGTLADATRIVFTVKANLDTEADADSMVQVSASLPTDAATDGVLYVNSAAATAEQRVLGSISLVDYTESDVAKKRIVVSIRDSLMAIVPIESAATFDVKYFTGTASDIIDEGSISVENTTTRLTT